MINILVRYSGRESFKDTLSSVLNQSYTDWRLIIHSDCGTPSVPVPHTLIESEREGNNPYFYNGYCNKLKSVPMEGKFFFLDDDDILLDGSLQAIADNCNSLVNIVRFSRGGRLKPFTDDVINGQIGMPCLVLDSTLASFADIEETEDGDFLWITKIVQSFEPKYHNFAVVYSEKRSFGVV